MPSYLSFARFYDGLMQDACYEKRCDYILKLAESFGHDMGITLDLACGTGTLTRLLKKRGVDVFGIKDQKIVVRGVAINAKRMLLKLDSGELLEISHSDLDIGAWPMDIVGKSVVVQGNVGIRTQVVNEFGIPVDKSGRVVQGRSGSGPFVYLYD